MNSKLYIDYFHFRNEVVKSTKDGYVYRATQCFLNLLDRYSKEKGCDVVFVVEPYAQNTQRYKESLKLSSKVYGVTIPYKDMRIRISEHHYGCTTCTSERTIEMLSQIEKMFSIVNLSDIEFDKFIPITGNTTNSKIIAVSSDRDVYYDSAWFENVSVITLMELFDREYLTHSTYKELLLHMFNCFIFGKPKDNIFGVLYTPLIKDYHNISEWIVKTAPKTTTRELLTFIENEAKKHTLNGYHTISEIIKERTYTIRDYLEQSVLTETFNNKPLLKSIYNVALKFLKKYNIPFEFDEQDYFNYIAKTCFNMYFE